MRLSILLSTALVVAAACVGFLALNGMQPGSRQLQAQAKDAQKKDAAKQIEENERKEQAEKREHREKQEQKRLFKDRKENEHRHDQPLGISVNLTFQHGPKNGDEPPLVVQCALGNYATHRIVDGPDAKHTIRISGELRRVDAKDRILLVYEAESQHVDYNDDFEASFSVKGSAIIQFGQSYILGYFGEHPLRVTARAGSKAAQDEIDYQARGF